MDDCEHSRGCSEQAPDHVVVALAQVSKPVRTSSVVRVEHPQTGEVLRIFTPKGTIPAEKLVRAFKRARTIHPNGTIRFNTSPIREVLSPYKEKLANSWDFDAQPEWIQFRKVTRRLLEAFASAAA